MSRRRSGLLVAMACCLLAAGLASAVSRPGATIPGAGHVAAQQSQLKELFAAPAAAKPPPAESSSAEPSPAEPSPAERSSAEPSPQQTSTESSPTAEPAPSAQPSTAPTPAEPAEPRSSPTPGPAAGQGSTATHQRPGTVRLPQGGTARLVRKQLGPDGVLPVPKNLAEATWWGADMGSEHGATLMAGHVNYSGSTGPFQELWHAKQGKLVTVVGTSGTTWKFRVSQVLTVNKTDLARRAQQLFGPDGKHRLVLVTCGGRWLGGDRGYQSNRIVIARPV